MQEPYPWSEAQVTSNYQLPGNNNLRLWSVIALLISIGLHTLTLFALDQVKIVLGIQQPKRAVTGQIHIKQVEVRPYYPEKALPPEETVTPPNDSAALLEEIDLLDLLPKDSEVDFSPEVLDPKYALKQANPLAEGELEAKEISSQSNLDLDSKLPEFGRLETNLKPAEVGQIIVDPGSVDVDDGGIKQFTDEIVKRGNQGLVDNGKLEGIESLDELLNLPANLLLSKKTLLPSDLLFEFNRSELQESAKLGLMKLALLIDKNPNLYCWIEGHTDLVGGEAFNLELSFKRAESVKQYLVNSMRMNPERIITRGFGKSQPLILEGDAQAQKPNRRVEIRMRKTPPTEDAPTYSPKALQVTEPQTIPKPKIVTEPTAPKALIVPSDLPAHKESHGENPPPLKAKPIDLN